MDRLCLSLAIFEIIETRAGFYLGDERLPRLGAVRERGRRRIRRVVEKREKSAATAGHCMIGLAVGWDLPHVGIDVNPPRLAVLAQRPMHGVALVETRADDQEHFE